MQKFKTIFALVMSVCMMTAYMPTIAFAADEAKPEEPVTAEFTVTGASAGDSISVVGENGESSVKEKAEVEADKDSALTVKYEVSEDSTLQFEIDNAKIKSGGDLKDAGKNVYEATGSKGSFELVAAKKASVDAKFKAAPKTQEEPAAAEESSADEGKEESGDADEEADPETSADENKDAAAEDKEEDAAEAADEEAAPAEETADEAEEPAAPEETAAPAQEAAQPEEEAAPAKEEPSLIKKAFRAFFANTDYKCIPGLKDGDTIKFKGEAGTKHDPFTVSKGDTSLRDTQGWCIQAGAEATSGTATAEKVGKNNILRKAMYVYGIKEDIIGMGDAHYTDHGVLPEANWNASNVMQTITQYAVMGDALITFANNHQDLVTPYAAQEAKKLVDKLKDKSADELKIPDNFEVYTCKVSNGQDFMFFQFAENSGKLKIKKASSNPTLTNQNPTLYTLAGAVYYVYTDAACTKRAKDVDGNNISLTTNASGDTPTAEVEAGTYYVKEHTAPTGYELDTTAIKVVVEPDETATGNSKEKPKPGYVYLQKNAASTDTSFCTEAPNNYSLKGAVYYVYEDEDCTKRAVDANGNNITLTTTANGSTNVAAFSDKVAVAAGKTYYAKEITASKGFKLDKSVGRTTVTINHTASNPAKFNSTEQPTWQYPALELIKITTEGNMGWRKLLGAQYKLSYYDVDPSTTDVSGKQPKRTWTFATRQMENKGVEGEYKAGIDIANDEPISGDAFYMENGKRIMPIGVFTIEEVKAPAGFALNKKVYYGKVYQPSNGADAKIEYEGNENLAISRALPDDDQHPIIKINKKSARTGENTADGSDRENVKGSLAGAQYDVYFDDPNEAAPVKVGTITTDENGQGELTTDESGKKLPLGRYYVQETVASPGYTIDALYYAENPDKTFSDGQHIVVARAKEINTEAFEYTVESLEGPHETHVSKKDITTGEELPGATLQVLDSEGNLVEEWVSTDKPHDILALHDETQGLKDGKYTLREITAPYGYDTAEDVEFEVKSGVIENKVEMGNAPIKLKTTATDTETRTHVGRFSTEEKIKDVVTFENLYAGREYTFKGTLMDKKTGEPMKDAEGKEITAEKTYTPEGKKGELVSGKVEMEFTVDASQFTKETVTVVFEKVYREEKELQMHADLEDVPQTIWYGGIASTTAVDKNSKSHNVLAAENTVVVDTVAYKNLAPNEKYLVEGELYDKTTGELTGITGSATFTPEESEGTVDVEFTFDASDKEAHTFVVYEKLYVIPVEDGEEGEPVEIDAHEEPDDEDQTVHVPRGRTTATDAETGEHITMAKQDVTIYDKVVYNNLIPGKEYTVTGKLVYKDDGSDVVVDGETVTASKTFTPEDYDGEVLIEFHFNGVPLKGKRIVAFETFTEKGYPVIIHADVNDEDQTFNVPNVGTTAIDSKTKDHVAANDNVITVIDTVKYEKLLPGKEYVMKGTMMSRSTGKPITMNGKAVTAEKKFTPDKEDGEIALSFKVNKADIDDDTLVAFEECYLNGKLVAEHKDLNDEGQTVHIPEVHTTAVDSETDDHIANGDDEVTVIDTVEYNNLVPGKEYTVIGTLVNKRTGDLVEVDGEPLTSQATFTPSAANGTVDVEFTFDGTSLRGDKVVAFEYLYFNNVLVAAHANLNDEAQSVTIPKIGTKVGKRSGKYVIDTVEYKGLIPGKEYVMKGYFVTKNNGSKVSGSAGEITFTPDSPNGKVEVKLNPGNGRGAMVAFETCYFVTEDGDEVVVGEHKDLNDKDQTYTPAPKTGDDYTIFFLGGAFMLSAALYLVMRKRQALKK